MNTISMTMPKHIFELLFSYYYSWDYFCHTYIDDEGEEVKVMQHILSWIKEQNIFDGVYFDEDKKQYTLTEKKADEVLKDHDEIVHQFHWQDLIKSLAGRDFMEKYDGKIPGDDELEEKYRELLKIMEHYEHEFSKRGIKYLKIVD